MWSEKVGERDRRLAGPGLAGEIFYLAPVTLAGFSSVQALERGKTRPRGRRRLVALAHTAHCAVLF